MDNRNLWTIIGIELLIIIIYTKEAIKKCCCKRALRKEWKNGDIRRIEK